MFQDAYFKIPGTDSVMRISKHGIELYCKDKQVGLLPFVLEDIPGISLYRKSSKKHISATINRISQTESGNIIIKFNFGSEPAVAEFESSGAGKIPFLRIKLKVFSGTSITDGVISFSLLLRNEEQPFIMIPGAFYGTNQRMWCRKELPKLAYREKGVSIPESHGWLMRADRATHPMVFATYSNVGVAIGISEVYSSSGGEWGYNSLGFITEHRGDRIIASLGVRDWPARILNHRYTDDEIIEGLPKNAEITSEMYLWWGKVQDRFGYEPFLRSYYYSIHDLPRGGVRPCQAIEDLVKGTIEAVCPETGLFYTLLSEDKNKTSRGCDLAFTGTLQIAQPLLEAALMIKSEESADYARNVIEKVIREVYNPSSGLFYDSYYPEKGWGKNRWEEHYEPSAYINGQACYFLIRAYRCEKARGLKKRTWLEATLPVLRRVVETQSQDGHFGINFGLKDGAVLDYNGFAGCWFVSPLAMLSAECPQVSEWAIPAACKGLEAYSKDLQTMEIMGSPMDIDKAPDQESILAFIKAARELYRLTSEEKYISLMERALHYNFTWKFAYNTHHRRDDICDWSSAGGDIASAENIHIHPMGNLVAEDIYFYYQHTGDKYFYDRARDTVLWGMQAYNRKDGEFGFGKKGWTSEQLYHTHVDYQGGGDDGGDWPAFLPWTNGSILSSLTGEIPIKVLEEMVYGAENNTSRRVIKHKKGEMCLCDT
jgi:hypothetical protein